MYRIGEFSSISKLTIKTLRYYEKEGILIPSYVDKITGYRYYETKQLVDVNKIISLRQMGLSIENIKEILKSNKVDEILEQRRHQLLETISVSYDQLSRLDYLLGGNKMNEEVIVKEIPDYVVYYKEGVIPKFSDITDFILGSAEECKSLNPNVECLQPEYCYVSYLDGEYKESDIKIRYSQAVTKMGKESDSIKFTHTGNILAACIYHKGSYENISESYSKVLNWVEHNNYEITESIRERYIDGCWNKESQEEYLTEIQVPIKKK